MPSQSFGLSLGNRRFLSFISSVINIYSTKAAPFLTLLSQDVFNINSRFSTFLHISLFFHYSILKRFGFLERVFTPPLSLTFFLTETQLLQPPFQTSLHVNDNVSTLNRAASLHHSQHWSHCPVHWFATSVPMIHLITSTGVAPLSLSSYSPVTVNLSSFAIVTSIQSPSPFLLFKIQIEPSKPLRRPRRINFPSTQPLALLLHFWLWSHTYS